MVLNIGSEECFVVGEYKEIYNKLTGSTLPCRSIFQSDGLSTHIRKRHPECIPYLKDISDILSSPDYIGVNPNESMSVEYVKRLDVNLLVAVKLDVQNNYLYVASMYNISEGKIARRVHSGRLIKIS